MNNSCRTTMSALRASNDFLLAQFLSHLDIFILSICTLSDMQMALQTKDTLREHLPAFRDAITRLKKNALAFERFQNSMRTKYPNLEQLIEHTCEVHVDYLCLRTHAKRTAQDKLVQEPLRKVFLFFLHLAYVHPYLFTVDDVEGTQYTRMKLLVQQEFLSTCIQLGYESTDTIRVIL